MKKSLTWSFDTLCNYASPCKWWNFIHEHCISIVASEFISLEWWVICICIFLVLYLKVVSKNYHLCEWTVFTLYSYYHSIKVVLELKIYNHFFFMDIMCKNLRGTFIILKWMKWEGKSNNFRSILTNTRIEMMIITMTLKLVILVMVLLLCIKEKGI